jgi:hypothetical protein
MELFRWVMVAPLVVAIGIIVHGLVSYLNVDWSSFFSGGMIPVILLVFVGGIFGSMLALR